MRPLPKTVVDRIGRNLHLNPNHPLGIVKGKVDDFFVKTADFISFNPPLEPNISITRAFDDLLIPLGHPSRSPSDTFYTSPTEVLRPQATSYQAAALHAAREAGMSGAVWACDVYRRDEVDRNHFPVFHQTDGAKLCSGATVVLDDLCEQLEGLVKHLWGDAVESRWDKTATFPFTQPSLELELRIPGREDWIECLGCGEIRRELLPAGERGWAFGIGLERIAMLLFGIDDIRLFWSTDQRFTSQFSAGTISRFKPFSTFPVASRDVSFWAGSDFQDNVFFEVLRDTAGGALETVKLVDEFSQSGRKSLCYRLEYRGVDHPLTHEEVNELQSKVVSAVVSNLSVALR